ncbi:GlmU family protein [Aegicerativicinus sediminis]|uniref:GlmU family protein n=1 Tax=Aegicerativicinus sediminis TaxID=2893202 RepID=UPI001E3D4666|nr:GlmU family protein [Aegicerativicinus sediminis]
MNYILFDGQERINLLPFTFTRPVSEIRIGILTITEKWKFYLKQEVSFKTEDYLQKKFPLKLQGDNIFINGSYLPSIELVNEIHKLKVQEKLTKNGTVIAYRSSTLCGEKELVAFSSMETDLDPLKINYNWDIFSKNGIALEADFELITKDRKSVPIPNTVNVLNKERIFIEEGAQLNFVSLNASNGPIYISKNSEIMEGSHIRGPFSLGEGAVVKMGAKIYGPTTVGPYCKVGGEITNSVLFAQSNKGHDGYLGNSVLAEWCNLGADTNNSNLKNNYAEVRQWNYASERFDKTGLQFCGLMMGDHSKCGINTMFNTGTVVGVSANIFGSGFPRNFVPSFSWGGNGGFSTYNTSRAFEVAEQVFSRRNLEFSQIEKDILLEVFELTKKYRHY